MNRPTPYATGNADPLKLKCARLERMLGFAGTLVRPLREEFDLLWRDDQARGWDEATAATADDFKRRVDRVLDRIDAGKKLLHNASEMPPLKAYRVLDDFDTNALVEAAKGLTATAKELRSAPAFQETAVSQGTGPLGANSDLKRLSSMFRKLLAPEPVVQRPSPAELRAEAERKKFEEIKTTFDSALKFVRRVINYANPRLEVVQVALGVTGRPGKKPEWEAVEAAAPRQAKAAGIPSARFPWILALAKLLFDEDSVAQRVQVALVQWQEARAQLGEAELLAGTLETTAAPTPTLLSEIDRFNVGRFRASAYPLGNLHMTFRGTPYLQDLFPPPAGKQA